MGDRRHFSGIALAQRDVTFDRYRFHPSTGQLWSGEEEVRLTPKASAVLGALLIRPGQPVTKEELFATVWPDTLVTDDALTSCIREIRKALADDPKQPRYIETRHRRGYRFVARVSPVTPDDGAESAPVPEAKAIAVLPFADMSAAHDQDYLCEGLAEELINALTHIDGIRVAARTSSFQFRGGGADVREVGRQLGVGTLLEGSVRKAGDRLRITVQLVDVATGYHRWSERFDRRLDDVFTIQDEIAEAVVVSLRGADLNHRERAALQRPQTTSEAYEYYLRGRQFLFRMSHPERSRAMFERAIDLDPRYGPAWAGLATVHATLYEWFGGRTEDLESAERASRKALELAPALAEAHTARGFALSLSRRYDEAEHEFDEAIRIHPNLFDAHYYFARSCFARGDARRSADLFRAAADVRQEDFQSPILLAQCLTMLGEAEAAHAANRQGIERAERVLALNPADARALSLGSVALFSDGQTERAMEWSRQSLELYPDDMSTLVNATCLRARAGRKEEALQTLERLAALGWGKRDWIEHDPDYDSLRDDPRFHDLLARLK